MTSDLVRLWISTQDKNGPLGFGVTAHSEEDAIRIIKAAGYSIPGDLAGVIIKNISSAQDVPYAHVRKHMGPIVVRGLWYPFTKVGTE